MSLQFQNRPHQEAIFEQLLEKYELCISGENRILGKANSKCKGPEAEICLKCSRNKRLECHNHGRKQMKSVDVRLLEGFEQRNDNNMLSVLKGSLLLWPLEN